MMGTTVEWLEFVVHIIETAAVTGTLVYVARQVNEAKRSTETTAYLAFENTVLQLDRLFLDYPNLRPYFYGNQDVSETMKEKTRIQVESTAEFIADFFDHSFTIQQRIPKAAEWSGDMWSKWIKEVIDSSPVLKRFLCEGRGWYVDELTSLAGGRPCGGTKCFTR